MGIMMIMTLIPAFICKFGEVDKTMSAQMFPLEALKMHLDMLLPIFISILIADIITDEYRSGTLKLPLIHPVSRRKLLNSKLFTILVTITVLLLFFLVFLMDWE
jgi:ABC-2 type transport system permease protein